MKRAFLILGAESTGTRLLTRVLMRGGCSGDDKHYQVFDEQPPQQDLIVWRKSVPHKGKWLILKDLLSDLRDYDPVVLITVRDLHCVERSQVKNRHSHSREDARNKVRRAYIEIFSQLSILGLPYFIIPYESFILHPVKTQVNLWKRFGLLTDAEPIEIINGNEKWL
jgi:hypothetical protein